MLGAQVEMHNPAIVELGIKSRALFADLRDELLELCNIDIELLTEGIFRVAVDETDRQLLLQRREWQTQLGQQAIWCEDHEVRKRWDLVNTTHGALYLPNDHQVRNSQMLLGLTASPQLGAQLLEQMAVIGFLSENGQIVGVKTIQGEIRANQVVLATGAWTGLIAEHLEFELPVFPVKGQAFLLNTYAPATPYTVFTHGCYILPKNNGTVYVGATEENVGFDHHPKSRLARQTLHTSRLPDAIAWRTAHFRAACRVTSGLRRCMPFLGPVPGIEGLYVAAGHFRNGILLSAITGQVMSDVLNGKTPSVDLTPFAVGRGLCV